MGGEGVQYLGRLAGPTQQIINLFRMGHFASKGIYLFTYILFNLVPMFELNLFLKRVLGWIFGESGRANAAGNLSGMGYCQPKLLDILGASGGPVAYDLITRLVVSTLWK